MYAFFWGGSPSSNFRKVVLSNYGAEPPTYEGLTGLKKLPKFWRSVPSCCWGGHHPGAAQGPDPQGLSELSPGPCPSGGDPGLLVWASRPAPKGTGGAALVSQEATLRVGGGGGGGGGWKECQHLVEAPLSVAPAWLGCRKSRAGKRWGEQPAALLPSAEHQWGRRVGVPSERRAGGNENKHKRARGKGRGAAASAPWQPMKGSDTMRNVFPSPVPLTGVGCRALRMARPQQGPGGTRWNSIGGGVGGRGG